MAIKHDLKRSLHKVLSQNKTGSFGTKADRLKILERFAEDLVTIGYGLRDIHGLKEKHIKAVVIHWQQQKLANATLKNRTSALRRLAEFLNKPQIVPKNTTLNIATRSYTPKYNRALYQPDFSLITDAHLQISLQLQRVFGLRREESLKLKPFLADQKDYLVLQPSWCKGGRGRQVPIRTEEQCYWLEQAKQLVQNPKYSLIPKHKNYIQQRNLYDKQVQRAGLRNLHGLRHAYAQQRYKELTGWEAPINGGLSSKQLTKEQRQIDQLARMIISEELGHCREQITVNYLSR